MSDDGRELARIARELLAQALDLDAEDRIGEQVAALDDPAGVLLAVLRHVQVTTAAQGMREPDAEAEAEELAAIADDDMPADPFEGAGRFSGMLDRARTLRLAVTDARTIEAVFVAVGALSDDEVRMMVVELALDALFERNQGGRP